jgi:glutathione peroxidase-family protein
VEDLSGKVFDFALLKEKNHDCNAAKCGNTPQYRSCFIKEYKDQGLVIVGFPAITLPQGQDNEEIATFAR